MATSGLDGFMKVWDIRAYKPVYKYQMNGRAAQCLTISHKGMLAAAFGSQVYVRTICLSGYFFISNNERLEGLSFPSVSK